MEKIQNAQLHHTPPSYAFLDVENNLIIHTWIILLAVWHHEKLIHRTCNLQTLPTTHILAPQHIDPSSFRHSPHNIRLITPKQRINPQDKETSPVTKRFCPPHSDSPHFPWLTPQHLTSHHYTETCHLTQKLAPEDSDMPPTVLTDSYYNIKNSHEQRHNPHIHPATPRFAPNFGHS